MKNSRLISTGKNTEGVEEFKETELSKV